jgi:hypothetical protein
MYLDLDQVQQDVCQLEAIYRAIRGPVRPHIWRMLGTPDPDRDPSGYQSCRWWDRSTPVSLALLRHIEALGLAYPWHHGRSTGPTLSPSRA